MIYSFWITELELIKCLLWNAIFVAVNIHGLRQPYKRYVKKI